MVGLSSSLGVGLVLWAATWSVSASSVSAAGDILPAPMQGVGRGRGVDAVTFDPAGPGFADGFALQIRQGNFEADGRHLRFGVAAVLPLGGVGALHAGFERSRALQARRASVGMALRPLSWASLGLSYRSLRVPQQGAGGSARVGTVDLGARIEPAPWLALSGGISTLNAPRLNGERLTSFVRAGLAVRPLLGDPALTLGIDTAVSRTSFALGDVSLRVVADVEPWQGVHGMVAWDRASGGGDPTWWGGLSISLGAVEAAAASASAGTELLFSQTLRSEPRAPAVERGHRRVRVVLRGELRPQSNSIWIGPPTVAPILLDLHAMARDPRIATVVITLGRLDVGLATIDELRAAIAALRAAHKRVEVVLSSADDKTYMVAAAADVIRMDPFGLLTLDGFSVTVHYFAAALQRLGVSFQAVGVGRYKSGPDPLTRDGPRPQEAEVQRAILQQARESWLHAMGRDGRISDAKLREALGEVVLSAPRALALGLVDELTQPSDPTQPLRQPMPSEPWSQPLPRERWGAAAQIWIVPIDGTIVSQARDNPLPGRSAEVSRIVAWLRAARTDRTVRGVVLRINSPGGDVVAAEQIWRAVRELAAIKPVVASLADIAASGGYYAALPAHAILAEPNTITGSIGIFSVRANISGLLQKLAVTPHTHKSDPHADWGGMNRPLRDDELQKLQGIMKQYYDAFVDRVAVGRQMQRQRAAELAEGKVYTGSQAHRLKLIDALGGLEDAVQEVKRRAGLGAGDWLEVYVPRDVPSLRKLATRLGLGGAASRGGNLLGSLSWMDPQPLWLGALHAGIVPLRDAVQRLALRPLALMQHRYEVGQ